jgi:hypothetical protein
VLGVDLIDLGEIINVGVEDRCLDQIGRRWPGRLEEGREVSGRLFGLGLDAVTDSTRSGSIPAIPGQNTNPPATIAWLYGRALPGAGR